MAPSEIIEKKVAETKDKHPDWKINNKVYEQIIADAKAYYDELAEGYEDDPAEGNYIDAVIHEENGNCSIFVFAPYGVTEDCQLSEFPSVLQHIDSLYLSNYMDEKSNDNSCNLSLMFCYNNLFFTK